MKPGPRRTAVRIALGAVVVVAVVGAMACSPVYVLKAGIAEAKILRGRRPIPEVVADPATDADTRNKLAYVLEARRFARDRMGIDVGDSYTMYTRLDSDTLAMVLSAAERDRFVPKTWWFPIVGRFPYRGFFDLDDALDAQADLEAEGLDTYLRPTAAFSTLGWFNDPVLSTVLRSDEVEIVSTVLHELSHQFLFVSGQVGFNESFATFAGRAGAVLFFCTREGGGEDTVKCQRAQARWRDIQRYGEFIDALGSELETLYGRADLTRDDKLAMREQVFAESLRTFDREVSPSLESLTFGGFRDAPLNNATLLGRFRYYHRLPDFAALPDEHGGLIGALRWLRDNVDGVEDPFDVLPEGSLPDSAMGAAATAAFVDVNVVSMATPGVLAHRSVLVRGDRIVAVGPVGEVDVPTDAILVPGEGRFLMPGLVDAHVHLRSPREYSSYLAHGVTSVVHLSGGTGDVPDVLAAREQIARGDVVGPSIYTAGPILDGDPPIFGDVSTVVTTPTEARRAVADQAARGYDLVKVYNNLPPDALVATVDEAHRRGLLVFGHVPRAGGRARALERAVAAGLDVVAHGEEVFFTSMYAAVDSALDRGEVPWVDPGRIPQIVELLREHDTIVIPNLSFVAMTRRQLDEPGSVLSDPEARWLTPEVRDMWERGGPTRRVNVERFDRSERAKFRFVRQLTRALSEADVPLLLGTDSSAPGLFPGASAHLELRELVEAGLTPYKALSAGTRVPGAFLGDRVRPGDAFGTVAPGQRADLPARPRESPGRCGPCARYRRRHGPRALARQRRTHPHPGGRAMIFRNPARPQRARRRPITVTALAALCWGCGSDPAPPPAANEAGSTAPGAVPVWNVLHADSTHSFVALSVVDARTVWGVGSGGLVARTTDAGATWSFPRTPAGDSLGFRDVHATSADEAFVLSIGDGTDSRIYHTMDGGASWRLSFMNDDPDAFFDCFAFWGRGRAVAFSDSHDGEFVLIRTDDAGGSWSRIDPAAVPDAHPGEGAFASSGTCVVSRPGGLGWFVTGASGVDTRVVRTTDFGATWTAARTPVQSVTSTSGIFSLSMLDDRTGVIAGGGLSPEDSVARVTMAYTDDGGATWMAGAPNGLAGAAYGVTWAPGLATRALVAGSPDGSTMSLDGGATWRRLDRRNYWTVVPAPDGSVWGAGRGHVSRLRSSTR